MGLKMINLNINQCHLLTKYELVFMIFMLNFLYLNVYVCVYIYIIYSYISSIYLVFQLEINYVLN